MAERTSPDRRARRGGATLAVMAKAPIPGFAKTRLVPRLGEDGAAALHALLVERTLATAATSGFDAVTLWCAPDATAPFFERLREQALRRGAAVLLRDQAEGDLGARIAAAFEAQLATGAVVVVGTDAPALSAAHLGAARAALAGGADAVLVPAEDGGYAAIGLARHDRALDALLGDVPWGTGEVLAATRARLARLGWSWRELAPVRDVDLPEDVDWLFGSALLTGGERERMAPYIRGGPAIDGRRREPDVGGST
jgi:rSAM/selenodomain-associated transferase 1